MREPLPDGNSSAPHLTGSGALFRILLSRNNVKKYGDNQRVREVDKERADNWHNEKTIRCSTISLRERAHVGDGVRRDTQPEPDVPARRDRRFVGFVHQSKSHKDAVEYHDKRMMPVKASNQPATALS